MNTKKDFEAAARIIRADLEKHGSDAAHYRIAREFSVMFANENPRFNRALFLKACGMEGSV